MSEPSNSDMHDVRGVMSCRHRRRLLISIF